MRKRIPTNHRRRPAKPMSDSTRSDVPRQLYARPKARRIPKKFITSAPGSLGA